MSFSLIRYRRLGRRGLQIIEAGNIGLSFWLWESVILRKLEYSRHLMAIYKQRSHFHYDSCHLKCFPLF